MKRDFRYNHIMGEENTMTAVGGPAGIHNLMIGKYNHMYCSDDEDGHGSYNLIVGLKNTKTGHTLCDVDKPILLESMEFPDPVISIAVEPVSKDGQDALSNGLIKLAEEDPTFIVRSDLSIYPMSQLRIYQF